MTRPESLPYRPCVGILLFNTVGEAFVGRRIGTEGGWQMPQGGIDDGESVRGAGLRELKEETGTAAAEIVAETRDWLTYDLPANLVGKVWKGRWRGQRQKWLACRFTGDDGDFDLAADPGHREFDAWEWVALDRLAGLIVPFKRAVYESVMAEFTPVVSQALGAEANRR